jgi:hypothetical protein
MHGGFGGGGGGGGGGGFGHGGGGGHSGGGHVSHHGGFGDSGHHNVHAPHGGGHDSSGGGSSFLQHALGMVHNGAGILGHLAQALTGHNTAHHAGGHSGGEPQNVMNWSSSIQAEKMDGISSWAKRTASDPGIQLLSLFVAMLGWVFVIHFIHHNDPDQRSHPMDNATWRQQLTLGTPGVQNAQQLSALPESGAPMYGQEGTGSESAGAESAGSMEAQPSPSSMAGQDSALMAGMNSMLRQQSPSAPMAHAPVARGSQRMFGARTAATMPPQDGSQLGQQTGAPSYQMSTMPLAEQTGFEGFGAPRELEAHEYAAAAPIGGNSMASGRMAFSAMAPNAMAPPMQQASYAPSYGQPGMFGQPGAQGQAGTIGQATSYPSPPLRRARSISSRSQFVPPPPPMTPSGLVPPPPPIALGDAGAMAGMYNMPANSGSSSDYNNAQQGRRFARRVVTER